MTPWVAVAIMTAIGLGLMLLIQLVWCIVELWLVRREEHKLFDEMEKATSTLREATRSLRQTLDR